MTKSLLHLRVGTRNSRLARCQTGNALDRLREMLPALEFERVEVSSPGDRDRGMNLRESPADFFTRDLDEAVLNGAIDGAIHSAKDVPDVLPDGLDWCWLPWREDPRDALVLRPGETRETLPPSPRIGISSERREAWSRKNLPAAEPAPIRGNIEDRLAQLDEGRFDAILMAGCALIRLGLADRITEWIPLNESSVPDGQGALALTFRDGDPSFTRIRSLLVNAVAFVGAGVGDAGLCTLAGADALRHCDICLHDTLMDQALLDCLPEGALRVDVGKRAGAHRVPQKDTTSIILEYARRGLRVVRLKGGDPCIFGRLAEEVEALDARQLPYRVVPGINSLSVMGASTGILLTRRGLSKGFTVMSGRGQGGTTNPVYAADRARLPLVLFMSLSVLPELLFQLRADGVTGYTPAAAVLETGSPGEQVLRGTVATLAEKLAQAVEGMKRPPPGLIVIGEVARFGFTREWGALQGQRVLLTCSEALQSEACRRVLDAGGRPIRFPLIRMRPEPLAGKTVKCLADYDWLVLSSPSAVRCLLDAMRTHHVDMRTAPRILACGPGTVRELLDAGLAPAATPEQGFGAQGMIVTAKAHIVKGENILRVRSDKAGPALAEALRELGALVEDVCLYRNEPVPRETLPPFDTVFFASSSAVAAFMAAWGGDGLSGKTVLAIGQPTATALQAAGQSNLLVSPEATVKDAIAKLAAGRVNRAIQIGWGMRDVGCA